MDISCNHLNLLYLTNQTYQNRYNKLNSENAIDIVDNDMEFYRKRIYHLVKEILRGKKINSSINNSFRNFANTCINHFKFEDTKELYQNQYAEMEQQVKKKIDISFNEMEINKYMMKSEKPPEPKTIKDFLNVSSTYREKRRKIPIPKRKKFNLKQEKFRTKGVDVKK
jgi:hypothetical protein